MFSNIKGRQYFFIVLSLFIVSYTAPVISAEYSEFKVRCSAIFLEGFADTYLESLVARVPSLASLAPNVRFTENGSLLALGDGFWATATSVGGNKLVFTDPESGGIIIYATRVENGMPSMFATRLKVEDREITEIETSLIRRNDEGPAMGNFVLERDTWDYEVPDRQKVSRQELADIADSYFEGITQGRGDITLFSDECIRFENA